MSVEPVELIGGAATCRIANDGFIRIENRELAEEFFGLAKRIVQAEDHMAADGSRCSGDELDKGLMGDAEGI